MGAALRAGVAYFAVVFAAGFAFGAARTIWLQPRLGAVGATLVELPFILGFAWWACQIIVRRASVPADLGPRALMGGLAFALLMVAEILLTRILTGGGPLTFAASLATPAGAIGLAAQVVFACFPLVGTSRLR